MTDTESLLASNNPQEKTENSTTEKTETPVIEGVIHEKTKTSITEGDSLEKTETPITEGDSLEKTETSITEGDSLEKTETPITEGDSLEKTETPITEGDSLEKTETPITEGDSLEKTETPITEAQESVAQSPKGFFKPRARKPPKVLDLRLLDIRVGRVDDVEPVEDEEGVFLLTIDVKKPNLRTMSSSLLSGTDTGFDVYDLIDTKVVTVLNTPVSHLWDETECNIRVLAAVRMGGEEGKEVEAVEMLRPPKKAKRGERILAEGYVQEQYWAVKEKMYNIIMKELVVDSEKRAVYRGSPLKVEGRSGCVTTKTLTDCHITHI